MRRVPLALVLAGLLPLVAMADPKPKGPEFDDPVPLEPIERFRGAVDVAGKAGGRVEADIVVRHWLIPNRQRIERFPEKGWILVELRAGELVTEIDGKREERKTEDFWTVPPGSTMAIETHRDSVVLHTVAARFRTQRDDESRRRPGRAAERPRTFERKKKPAAD